MEMLSLNVIAIIVAAVAMFVLWRLRFAQDPRIADAARRQLLPTTIIRNLLIWMVIFLVVLGFVAFCQSPRSQAAAIPSLASSSAR